jgi:hypothetical protein
MYGNLKITNSAEVFLKDLTTGGLSFFGCTIETGMNKTLESNDLRCGIDAGLAGIAYTNPDMTLTIATVAWNDYLIQLQNDEDWETAVTLNIPKSLKNVALVTSIADGTYTFDPAIVPVGGEVFFQDSTGKSYVTSFTTPTATVTDGAGLTGTFSWLESVSNALTFDFKVGSLPKATGLVLHHIAYDIETNEPVADIYFEFDKVVGDGNLDLSMALNNTAGTSVTLRALSSGGKFARQIYVPRA